MYGVVLWSDRDEKKAVIWCEDHGDLAFYRQDRAADPQMSLDAGDWVQFDLSTDRNMRFAHNPRLVAEGMYPGLADVLESDAAPRPAEAGSRRAEGARIIPFRARQRDGGKGAGAQPCLA